MYRPLTSFVCPQDPSPGALSCLVYVLDELVASSESAWGLRVAGAEATGALRPGLRISCWKPSVSSCLGRLIWVRTGLAGSLHTRWGFAGQWEICPAFKNEMAHKSFVFLALLRARWAGQHSHRALLTSSQHSWGTLCEGGCAPKTVSSPHGSTHET